MQIQELINGIKRRPKMYVKEIKIEYIYYLLQGYCGANHKLNSDEMDSLFCCWFWKWIGRWIADNVDSTYVSKTAFWYDDIKVISEDEQKEVALFFELCEQFFADYEEMKGYFEWRKE